MQQLPKKNMLWTAFQKRAERITTNIYLITDSHVPDFWLFISVITQEWHADRQVNVLTQYCIQLLSHHRHQTCQIYSSPKSAERCNFRKHSPIFSSLTHDAAKGINRHKDRKCHSIMGAFSYHFPFVVQNWWNHMSFLKLWCTELQGHCT